MVPVTDSSGATAEPIPAGMVDTLPLQNMSDTWERVVWVTVMGRVWVVVGVMAKVVDMVVGDAYG